MILLIVLIAGAKLQAAEGINGSQLYFEIDQTCDQFLWKSEHLGKIKIKTVEELVSEVQIKMEDHFNELKLKYPEGLSAQNHSNEWELLKWRSPKIRIYCERNSEFLGTVRFDENKILLSSMYKDSNYLSTVSDNILFHEIYHYLSGIHGTSVLDYTVICTAGRYGYDSYLNSVGNLRPATGSNREVMLKLCAKGGIGDLISSDHYENILKLGMISYTPDLWLKSVNNVYCKGNEKKFSQTCDLVKKLLIQNPMKAQFKASLEELHLRNLLEKNNENFSVELERATFLNSLINPSDSLRGLIKKISHKNRQLLSEKLFKIVFEGNNLNISATGENYCQRYELIFNKVEGRIFQSSSKLSNSWCHSGKKIEILSGQKYLVELFYAGEYLGKYYLLR